MTTLYRVLAGFRVGATQRWLMPDDKVALLPCEAQYPLSRGWLVAEESTELTSTENIKQSAKKEAEEMKGAKSDASE